MREEVHGPEVLQVELGSPVLLVEVGSLEVGEVLERSSERHFLEDPVGLSPAGCAGVRDGATGKVDVVGGVGRPISPYLEIH